MLLWYVRLQYAITWSLCCWYYSISLHFLRIVTMYFVLNRLRTYKILDRIEKWKVHQFLQTPLVEPYYSMYWYINRLFCKNDFFAFHLKLSMWLNYWCWYKNRFNDDAVAILNSYKFVSLFWFVFLFSNCFFRLITLLSW